MCAKLFLLSTSQTTVQYPQKKLRQQPNFCQFLRGWLKKTVAYIKQLFADLGSVLHLV
jgi:hypothetical protein